ncbi:MAG: T9SS type B sorting domain-containing protein [Bacteroidetes bacterium]|jgi:gliding motility-associated-like protein|nr:T9SS type B sorting domain-containing protein [Bacteroidota bacterium]
MPLQKIVSYFIFLWLLASSMEVMATHNRAGEIQFEQIGPLSVRATVITYTKASSVLADRDSVRVMWGDGNAEWVRRSNGNGELLPNDTKFNIYVAEHTYAGRSTYTISMMDPNRNGGILNVNPPNSESIPFYIEATFTFLNPQFQGFNNSAILLQPPIDFGCVGQRFIHNPSAYDPDGDSLAYELVVPKQDVGQDVDRYSFPNQIGAGANNTIFLDEITGDFIWETPQVAGEYNIAIRIKEYRNGVLINSFIRDLQIDIRQCDNAPPEIEVEEEICLIAGDTLDIPIRVTDPDLNPQQRVRVELRGGPFVQDFSPAVFNGPNDYVDQPLEGRLVWPTTCEHISPQFYSITIRAVDDFFTDNGLATLKTIRIKVTGPPPEDLTATPDREEIFLQWAAPYSCEDPADDSFRGFTVWRKEGSRQYIADTCQPNIQAQGYEPIAFAQLDQISGNYSYIDRNVVKGRTYCYRVTGEFAEFSSAGNPFNLSESLPSPEICVQLKRDVPLMTKASILETDPAIGAVDVRWTHPLAEDLDTLENPGPYRYVVEFTTIEEPNQYQEIPGATFNGTFFTDLVDTQYIHRDLNTTNEQYLYRVAFYANGQYQAAFGYAEPASTIFLSGQGRDREVQLNWSEEVPWNNIAYTIFRSDNDGISFDSIGNSQTPNYIDRKVENNQTYCYQIESEGVYGLMDLPDIILNFSQEICVIPIDTVAPCLPQLQLRNICNEANPQITDGIFRNNLMWSFQEDSECLPAPDLIGFNIYLAPEREAQFELLAEVDSNSRSYTDLSMESFGCYAITTIDSAGNESRRSSTLCVEICPEFELPNAFTPNDDGFNDLFIPRQNRFVREIEFHVYNRWGNLVFETNNPNIEWNGKDLNGNPVPEGTYFYKARLFFNGQGGSDLPADIDPLRSGYIELVR